MAIAKSLIDKKWYIFIENIYFLFRNVIQLETNFNNFLYIDILMSHI